MPRVIHFDLPADDPERAIEFYRKVFGWAFHRFDGPIDYWLITTGSAGEAGIDGGMAKRRDPSEGVINTIGVPSVDEYLMKIVTAGGKILQPKMAIPGVGWYASCRDPERNIFGLMEDDPSAR